MGERQDSISVCRHGFEFQSNGRVSICKLVLKEDRGLMGHSEYTPRTKVELAIKDELDMLLRRTRVKLGVGGISGKIFVLEVPAALDIKTGTRGESAI